MIWTLQSKGNNPGDYEIVSDDGNKIAYKYSESQQSIRMRFHEYHGVYVLDEGCFNTRKFAIRNVYGSEIGSLVKGTRIENTGTLKLDSGQKFYYIVNTKESCIEVTTQFSGVNHIHISGDLSEENALLSLIVFAWMQSVTVMEKQAFV